MTNNENVQGRLWRMHKRNCLAMSGTTLYIQSDNKWPSKKFKKRKETPYINMLHSMKESMCNGKEKLPSPSIGKREVDNIDTLTKL